MGQCGPKHVSFTMSGMRERARDPPPTIAPAAKPVAVYFPSFRCVGVNLLSRALTRARAVWPMLRRDRAICNERAKSA